MSIFNTDNYINSIFMNKVDSSKPKLIAFLYKICSKRHSFAPTRKDRFGEDGLKASIFTFSLSLSLSEKHLYTE